MMVDAATQAGFASAWAGWPETMIGRSPPGTGPVRPAAGSRGGTLRHLGAP